MCGFAGWFDQTINMSEKISTLYKMSETLSKRGPDENGLYINKGCALVHRRLVVIDKENGKQPMAAKHNGKLYIMVYNGELYNTNELREKLTAVGMRFSGHSDTEVVLKAYIKYGAEFQLRILFISITFSLFSKTVNLTSKPANSIP